MKYLALATLLLLVPSASFAASFSGALLTTNPTYPEPGQRTTITATLISDDPSSSIFTWTVDGREVTQGEGATQIAIDAPELGDSASVAVTVTRSGRIVATGNTVLAPAIVTLEWEAESTIPPFYTGRPLLTGQGTARVFAIPSLVRANGTRIQNSDVRFTWSVDGQINTQASGFGKDYFTVTPPLYNSAFRVSVLAESRDGSLRASAAVTLTPRPPQIAIYEYSPLGGVIDNQAIVGNFLFTTEEVSFIAYPLFVSRTDPVTMNWTLNGSPVTLDTGDSRLAIFKRTGPGQGAYQVGVGYTSVKNFLHKASQTFLLHF